MVRKSFIYSASHELTNSKKDDDRLVSGVKVIEYHVIIFPGKHPKTNFKHNYEFSLNY